MLGRQYNYNIVRFGDIKPPKREVIELLPFELSRQYMVFPLGPKDDGFQIAMTESTDTDTVEDLHKKLKKI